MSDLIRALNLIKTRRDPAWLTVSQQKALAALQEALRVPCTVNLFGATGVGKTFLAWTLADELGYTYFPHLDHFERIEDLHTTGVVLDNCRPDRRTHRHTLKTLSFQNVRYAVLITRQMIQDYTHYVELALTPADRTKAWDNLATLGIFREAKELPNLWHLVNPHL
ncbi:MAG: hypothetical protein H8E47_04545 [Anaerolineales bacterium]|nr:hypothetical protein [Anaerolineales bacterium]